MQTKSTRERIGRHGIEKLLSEAIRLLRQSRETYTHKIRDNIKALERKRSKEGVVQTLHFIARSLGVVAAYVAEYEPRAFDFRRRVWVPLTRTHLERRAELKAKARAGYDAARVPKEVDSASKLAKNAASRWADNKRRRRP